MASPINSGIMMSNLCPSTFLDKNINIAAELDITNNEKKYSPGSNFAKWMLQEIKRLILNIMSDSRSVNTDILDYFHPMPGTENNGNRTWMAATGVDEYIEIKQTGDKSFNITLVGRDKCSRKGIPYSGVAVATIIKSLSEKTAALETHSADTVLRKKLVNSIVMKNTDYKHVIPADIENNIYDLLRLRVQQDEWDLPVQKDPEFPDDCFDSMRADAHRCVKDQEQKKSGTKINSGTKITCCGVELSKDILEILADKTKKHETAVEHTLGHVVADVCFKEDERSQVRELLKQSNGNVTDDKIDEIVACLASPQGIACFYYSSLQFYQKYLKEKSSDVQDLLKKSSESFSSPSGLGNQGNIFMGHAKYVNEMDFTINGFSQKMYVAMVKNIDNEVKLQCARYITTGSVDEKNSISDKIAFTFSGAATTADL
ncbi:hypothetical protein P4901_04845 [Escherichia coli]|uniref:hypothetical protein n=1 Tax=Escherichia coli TaxID=562 RepID=UPI001C1D02F5|nr:hypothetical protein [Escherichia coli]EEV5575255.1 hypothetical protein [Escherichia coli]EKK7367078.1 hypothetical protein [Escherichia coli]MCA7559973.1 hypothetical protein [Escherichia coli]MCH6239458.1 hypothetical protein [Escherichia coli]HBE5489390.1 hypothetical protein [Escherichia coli]